MRENGKKGLARKAFLPCVAQRSLREEMKKKDSRAEGAGDAEGGPPGKFFLIFSLPSA